MPKMTISLPKANKPKALVKTIDRAIAAVERVRNPVSVEWLTSYYWLQGIRSFNVINYQTGSVQFAWEGKDGKLRFKLEDALQKSQVEIGRLAQLDLFPVAKPRPHGLQSQRKAAMGQVALDFMFDKERLRAKHFEAYKMVVQFGPCGLLPLVDEWPDGTAIFDIDIVPPWELGALPAAPDTLDSVAAHTRDRMLPLEVVEEKFGEFPSKKRTKENLKAVEVPFGDSPRQANAPSVRSARADSEAANAVTQATQPGTVDQQTDKNTPLPTTSWWVRLVEVWVKGPAGTLARYIAKVGDEILVDEEYGTAEWKAAHPNVPLPPPFPLQIAGYNPVGGAYPRSFVAPLISVNKEIEELVSAVFKNIRDWDAHGIVTLPANMGINERSLKVSTGPKILRFEPDPMTPDVAPGQLRPVSAGALPGQIANFALQLMDREAGQGDLFGGRAPGRVDSQAGLDFLFQTQSVPLDVPANSLAQAFAGIYSALLYEAKQKLSNVDKVKLTTIDDQVAGIVMDPNEGTVDLELNPIPWPHEVTIQVRNVEPVNKQEIESRVGALFQQGLMSPLQAQIYLLSQDVGYQGMWPELEANIEKAKLNNILLFGDGQEPGEPIYNDLVDNPEVFERIARAFMARTVWQLASDKVRLEFENYLGLIQSTGGSILPEGAPNPEDAAALQFEAQQGIPQVA